MKKIISVLAIMFLIMSILIGTVNAASASIRVSASNTSPEIGETITATVTFSVPVGTAELRLNYNNSVLQYVSSNAWNATNEGSAIKLAYIDTSFQNQTISSMRVTFKVIGEGTSSLTASGIVLSNAAGEELSASASGTTVTVEEIVEDPQTNTTPSTPSTPTNPSTPSKPSTNNGGSTSGTTSNNNNRPSSNTTTTAPTTNNNNSNEENEEENNTVENQIIANETNTIANEINNKIANQISNNIIETEEQSKGPSLLSYIMIGIIAIAIIVIIIIMIKNKDKGGK